MDKYTVDLDKVLNDFEYSELTDNFHTSKTYHAQGTSNYASSSKSKTGDAKHSITNVFHSLNEYLNTDISSNAIKIQVDDKEINYGIPNKDFPQIITSKSSIADNSVDKLKEIELTVLCNETESDLSCYKPVNDNSNNTASLLELKSEDNINDNKKSQVELMNKESSSNTEDLLDLDNIVLSNGISEENKETFDLNYPGAKVDNCLEVHVSINDQNLVERVEDKEVEFSMPFIKDDKISDVDKDKEQVIGDSSSITKSIMTYNIPNKIEIKTDSTKEVMKEVISFDNALDIDDLAITKFLEDLESEYQDEDEPQTECILNKERTEIKNEGKALDETEKVTEEITKYTKEGNLTKEVVIQTPVLEESVTIESPISASVSDNKDSSYVSENVDQKDTESISSLERPKMLQLNSHSLNEVPKREINLIGNPGSTPYNNVYISKELQTTTVQKENSSQDESETSPSVSPTFSEASTETLTDSTESDSEDEAKTTGSSAQKQIEFAAVDRNEITPVGDVDSIPESYAETTTAVQSTSAVSDQVNLQSVENSVSTALPNQPNQDNIAGFWLGKEAPLWIPDSDALSCLHCDARFTVIKRRHHCRACGLVLCSKCCNLKYRLEYLDAEARVCSKCYAILNMDTNSSSGSEVSQTNSPNRQPNPNNPMEYCSVVPPMQQVGSINQIPPTVMVPVGVLKRKGSAKGKSNKSVMFCDGIRPGSDLTKLDTDFNYSGQNSSSSSSKKFVQSVSKINRNVPTIDPQTKSFIPSDSNSLPPTVTVFKSDITYVECVNGETIVETLKCEKLTFALQRNLHVHVKIINMDCCINKKAWCFSTEGLISVGQDEIVYVIELMDNEKTLPVDIFYHINSIYNDAVKGTTVTEMGLSLHNNPNFLDFKNHAGFLYIRPTFQCLQNIIRPTEPYLIGLLIHRWETPWAKIFPLRLVLRLGAEYRYYPSPIISTRHRDSVFVEIGHTIINILADFRNFSYTLPNIRGLTIHMEDKNTTVTIPENRYDQVVKSLNNSSDHILAFSGNFSTKADSHLVCVQDTQASSENSYTTHAINILNKPRKVTGASFIVFNGALKSSTGLTAKSSIIEDGLMIQIPSENMTALRESLRNMKNHTIQCGCINAPSDETVNIIWGEPDTNFNIGVTSPIDNEPLSGIPSIRVHNGKEYICNSGNSLIRWTEVFILQNTDEQSKAKDPIDISKIAESISKATCQALVKYLDLLTSNNFHKIGIRTTLHVENVSYSAGSNNIKLPPIYMKNLDNELIPVLHRITSNNLGDNAITLELIFRILNT